MQSRSVTGNDVISNDACPTSTPNRGFTLVELLVVIAIIAILVALLLPAVNSAREAARRVHCINNLKQLALACRTYHDAHERFPPAGVWPKHLGADQFNLTSSLGPNWVIMVLPFLEEQSLFDSFNTKTAITRAANRESRGKELTVMKCPSDFGHEVRYEGRGNSSLDGDNWARGNYAANVANCGLGGIAERYAWGCGRIVDDDTGAQDPFRRGVLGINTALRLLDITDGTSKTMLLSEIRVGLNDADRRGTWAMSGLGSGLFWHGWHDGSMGSANGPNDCSPNSDDIPRCLHVINAFGQNGIQKLRDECMTCNASRGREGQTGARSRHPGGVHAALVDGSVHFISDDIETSRFCCSAWDRLILSGDGQAGDSLDDY